MPRTSTGSACTVVGGFTLAGTTLVQARQWSRGRLGGYTSGSFRDKPDAMDFKSIDEAARRVMGALPAGFDTLRHDLEKNLQGALRTALDKMDLVTREEFEIQQEVLLRTRAKLDALEKVVRALEAQLAQEAASPADDKTRAGTKSTNN